MIEIILEQRKVLLLLLLRLLFIVKCFDRHWDRPLKSSFSASFLLCLHLLLLLVSFLFRKGATKGLPSFGFFKILIPFIYNHV